MFSTAEGFAHRGTGPGWGGEDPGSNPGLEVNTIYRQVLLWEFPAGMLPPGSLLPACCWCFPGINLKFASVFPFQERLHQFI